MAVHHGSRAQCPVRRDIADGDTYNVGSSASLALRCNDHEAGPSMSIVDLAPTDDVYGHLVYSGNSRMWETEPSASWEVHGKQKLRLGYLLLC